jgi:hypothetical protein
LEEAPFKKDGFPVDTEQFWIGVLQHKAFKELATFALTCLITPVSIAVVERIFSLVSSIKTKARNRMQLNLIDAIVRVRAELLLSSKCCKDFIASPEILKKKTSHRTRFMPYVLLIPVSALTRNKFLRLLQIVKFAYKIMDSLKYCTQGNLIC